MAIGWIPWDVAAEAGAVVGTAGVAARSTTRKWLSGAGAFARELAIVLGLYALWRVVGAIEVLNVNGAVHAGQNIWNAERFFHLPNERALQQLFLKSSVLIELCNAYYAAMHFPAMIAFLLWLWFRHRDKYPPIRNVVALTTLWCLAIQLIPVAPPRLVPALHIEDTPVAFGQTVYPSFGKSGPAQLSAMPSVHVAWAVIIGVGIVLASSNRLRWFALAYPVLTTIVVVVTGNHYWADAIVGVAVLALAVVFERQVRLFVTRRLESRRARATARVAPG